MNVLATILPVFFMIILGLFAKKNELVTSEQVGGMNSVIYNLLFPIMVFNALFTTNMEVSAFLVVLFVFLLHMVAIFIGKLTSKFVGGPFSHISGFLMCTVDGGNVCFPLYATIVGSSYIGNIVLLDIACIFIVFLVIPLMVSTKSKESADIKSLLKNIICTPIIVSMLCGVFFNWIGVYGMLQSSEWYEVYNQIISMATGPIVAMILFIMGYQFKVEKSSIRPLVVCVLSRFAIMAVGITIFIICFSPMVNDKTFLIAILLYFMCPPALVLPTQIMPLYKNKNDASFMSAFISIYMIITLIAYTIIAAFIA